MIDKSIVIEELIDIFDKTGVQTPSNFEEICNFIHKYLNKKNKTIESGDVAFGFKLWIESKCL